jgi:triphosphatase
VAPHPPHRRGDVSAASAATTVAPHASEQAVPAPQSGWGAGAGASLALALEPADLPELRRHRRVRELAVGRASVRHLHALVFDTPGLDLLRLGLVLEVRRAGRRFVQMLRSAAAEQPASETPLSAPVPRPEQITPPELRDRVLNAIAEQPLRPVLEMELSRSRRALRSGDTAIALELDVGELRTARGTEPLCELALRHTGGEAQTSPLPALYELATDLQRTVRLRLATRSPLERGIEQLAGVHPEPQRARRVRVRPDATLEQAIAASLADALAQVLANEEPARCGFDPEGVHQMRVGVRRLRSALSLFRAFLPAEAVTPIREELRWLGGELGAARDLDVFHDETLAPLCRLRADDPHLKELETRVAALRADAQRRVRDAVDSLRYAELMLRLDRFVHTRAWREQALSPESARLFQPAAEPARALLERRRRKLRRLARGLDRAGDAERHALRIQTKKLRYASEFLRSLFPGRGARRFLARTRTLQDHLGHLNDAATTRTLLAQSLVAGGGPADTIDADLLRAASFVEGWSARGAAQALEGLEEAVSRLLRGRPFWSRRE